MLKVNSKDSYNIRERCSSGFIVDFKQLHTHWNARLF